jgi:hypothetical protein
MNAVCPACGVAVVSGYVRCPKCHTGLPPGPARTQRSAGDPGGTALERKGFPISAVISAVIVALGVAAAIILVFGVRNGGPPTEAAAALPAEPAQSVDLDLQRRVVPPVATPAAAPAAPEPGAQDPAAAAIDLESTLRKQRLWGRAVIAGPRIDVRSGSCADPAMRPMIESKKPLLRSAGLTRLRCLEQSGAVVFERDL